MRKISYDGETYYYNKGLIYDSTFIEVPKTISQKILLNYYMEIDYEEFDESELLTLIKDLKNSGFYDRCLTIVNYGLKKFNTSADYYITVFPIITSCYRSLGQAQKAIDFWMGNKRLFSSCLSVPLLTSLAAAYCDIGNYEMAKKCANRAYAIQGGSKNYTTELSLVYQRIKKESEED